MTTEIVYSAIKDDKINSHLNNSEIWKNAYHLDEITKEFKDSHPIYYRYTIKFDGLRPIQCTKFETV